MTELLPVVGPLVPAPHVPVPAGPCGCDAEAQSCPRCDGEDAERRRRPSHWPAEATPQCMRSNP